MMVGLRTQEDTKFLSFLKLIQEKAKRTGNVFFIDCCEGHTVFYDDIICFDCSGWLVPEKEADSFEKDYLNFQDDAKWQEWEKYAAWVTWSKENNIINVSIELL